MFSILKAIFFTGVALLIAAIWFWGTDLPGTSSHPTSQWQIALSGVKDLLVGESLREPASGTSLETYLLKPRLLYTEKKKGDGACRCGPWGDCPNSVCTCEELCPEHYQILDVPEKGRFRSRSQTPAIENTDDIFLSQGYLREFGYCWGHVSLTRNMNWLAHFRPEVPSDAVPTQPESRRFYYQQRLENLARGNFTEVPGFVNVEEFSKAYPDLFSRVMTRLWKVNAMSPRSIPSFFAPYLKLSKAETDDLIGRVRSRLEHGMQPKLYLGAWAQFAHIHIVRAISIQEGLVKTYTDAVGKTYESRRRLCVEDPNVPFEKNENCQNFIVFTENDGAFYSKYDRLPKNSDDPLTGRLGSVGISYEDDAEQVRLIQGTRQFCLKQKKCR